MHDDFWTFSGALYARPGVKDACLALQDDHGADVNMILFCLWTEIPDGAWAPALALSRRYQDDIIGPIRAERRGHDKDSQAEQRKALLAVELDKELAEQQALEGLVEARKAPDQATGRAQLVRYGEALGIEEDRFLDAAAPILA